MSADYSQQKSPEVHYSKRLYRFIGIWVAKPLLKTKVTPNQITFLSFVCGVIAAILFMYNNLLWGVILAQLSIIFDMVDGQIAKLKNKSTLFGRWMDSVSDHLKDPLIFFGLAWGHYAIYGNHIIWIFCAIAIMFRLLIYILYFITQYIFPYSLLRLNKAMSQSVFTKLFTYSVPNIHILLLIMTIFNQILPFMIIMSVYGCLFYFASVFIIAVKHNEME